MFVLIILSILNCRTLYCYPNNIREPYYPSLIKIKTPPGALPISSQGTVQVCTCGIKFNILLNLLLK
jgi:hypothetical protein